MKPPLFPARKPTAALLFILLLLFLTTLLLTVLYHPPSSTSTFTSTAARNHHYHSVFLSASSNATVSSFLRSLSLRPHLSPSPPHLHLFLSLLPPSLLATATSASFHPLLSYPTSVSLSSSSSSGPLPLSEPDLPSSVVLPYHAFSPSSSPSLSSLPVFVNFGRRADYAALSSLGVSLRGHIAIARRGGGLSRWSVVRNAEKEGAAAVLIFGEGGEREGVERGTVMRGVGDALTPGWGAVEGGEALAADDDEVKRRFPGIPSVPVSRECVERVLREMGGAEVPRDWREEGLDVVVERVGPGPVVLNFTYRVSVFHSNFMFKVV